MDMDRGSGTATLAPNSAEVAGYEHQPPSRHTGRAATRWLLVVPFVVMAPIARTAMPRVTSPAMVAEEVIEIGLTHSARAALVDGFASQLAERRNAPLTEATMREVFDRSLTQEWFDEQVLNIAGELDRWLLGTTTQLPDLVIDLVPIKTALASDPDAMALVASFVGCEGIECAPEGQTVEVALVRMPDQAALLTVDPRLFSGRRLDPRAGSAPERTQDERPCAADPARRADTPCTPRPSSRADALHRWCAGRRRFPGAAGRVVWARLGRGRGRGIDPG